MKLENKYLEVLIKTLQATELNLSDSRKRDKSLKEADEAFTTLQSDRKKIIETYTLKNEDGTPKVEDNQYQLDPAKIKELATEVETLFNEEIEIETPDNLKEMIEKTTYMPKYGEVALIDEIIAKI